MLEKVKKATIPDEFEQAVREHEKFLSVEEVAKRGKAREEQVRREKIEEAHAEILAKINKALVDRVKARISAHSSKFKLDYTPAELDAIIKRGKVLGLSEAVIEDLIFTGSRKAKPISAAEMVQQMENWVNIVQKRGFPYRFADLAEYQKFSRELIDGLKKAGIPDDDVRIQGSSLRKPGANDVDVAVFVDKTSFAKLLIDRFSGRIKMRGSKAGISLKGKSFAELQKIAGEIEANPKNYNAQARTFQNAIKNGIISSKSDISSSLKAIAKSLQEEYPGLNIEAISILIKGGLFEMLPDLPVKG